MPRDRGCFCAFTDFGLFQMKSLGPHSAVQRLWAIVGPLLRDHGFNAGVGTSTSAILKPPPSSSPNRERRVSTSSAVLVQDPSGPRLFRNEHPILSFYPCSRTTCHRCSSDGVCCSPPLSPLAKVPHCRRILLSFDAGCSFLFVLHCVVERHQSRSLRTGIGARQFVFFAGFWFIHIT